MTLQPVHGAVPVDSLLLTDAPSGYGVYWILPKPDLMPDVPPEHISWQLLYVYPPGTQKFGRCRILTAALQGAQDLPVSRVRDTVSKWAKVPVPSYKHPELKNG